MKRSELIESLMADTYRIIEEVKHIASLEEELIARRSNPDRWSAIECLEHLNIADAHYLIQFDRKLSLAKPCDRESYKPGWLGNYFVKMIKPKADGGIPSPMKTMRKFDPEVKVQRDTISKFLEDQEEILGYLSLCKTLDLQKIKIPSAIGAIVTFRLGDALRFLIGHNQRHIIQANNVLKELGVETDLPVNQSL